jgi:hypothetical protein
MSNDPLDPVRAILAQRAAKRTADPKYQRQAMRVRDNLYLSRQQRAAWKLAVVAIER